MTPPLVASAVLAQFLLTLNKYCLDEHGMRYQLEDYHEYVFAKARSCRGSRRRCSACYRALSRLGPGKRSLPSCSSERPAPAAPQVWGCDQNESNRIVHDFFKSKHFAEEIPPVPGALESLRRIGGSLVHSHLPPAPCRPGRAVRGGPRLHAPVFPLTAPPPAPSLPACTSPSGRFRHLRRPGGGDLAAELHPAADP